MSPPVVGFDESSSQDPPVVPPDVFFGIWAVITVGCVVAAGWGFPHSRASRVPYRRVQLPVSAVQLLFIVWLVLARAFPPLTGPVFVAMLALLAYALKVVTSTPSDRVTDVLLGGSLGLYAGWAAGAVWLNLASVLPSDARGDHALLAALLAAAALTCVSGALFFNGTPSFVIGASWACAGICLSAAMNRAPDLAAVAAAGLLATFAAGVLPRPPHRTTTDP